MITAQSAPYWDTSKVALAKSVQDILTMLDKHGCSKTAVQYGRDADGGKTVDILWELKGRSYVARFTTLTPEWETRRTKARLIEMAEAQMGRIAWWYLKSMLVMVQYGHDEVMAPYMLQQTRNGESFTIQGQIAAGHIANPAPWAISTGNAPLALSARNDEFTEVPE